MDPLPAGYTAGAFERLTVFLGKPKPFTQLGEFIWGIFGTKEWITVVKEWKTWGEG